MEFLFKLNQYFQELNKEINDNYSKTSTEEGYIINYKLIQTLKKFYYYDEIKYLFERANSINDIIISLPKEYIPKVQKQNEDILKKKELYFPEIAKYGKLEIKYFINGSILKSKLLKYLGKDFYPHNKLERSKVLYAISNQKLIITYEMVINIGKLFSDNIFISEILILCSGEESLNSIFNEVKVNKIDNFINQVNILEKNIGKYKGSNIVVFINEKYIPKKPIKNEFINNNHLLQKDFNNNSSSQNHNITNDSSQNQNMTSNQIKQENLSQQYFEQNLSSQKQDISINQDGIYQKKSINKVKRANDRRSETNWHQTSKEDDDKVFLDKIQQKKEINNLLYIMIDLEITNIKINNPLNKKSKEEKYYQINLDWFYKYLENRNIQNLFNNQIIIEKIKEIVKKEPNYNYENILKKLKLYPEINNEIENMYNIIRVDKTYNQIPIETQGKTTFYYNNFILLSESVINILYNKIQKLSVVSCLLGDKLAFLKLIFNFSDKIYLRESIELLKEHGFSKYKQYFLLFNNDYTSPIFDKNNFSIGYAYLYNPKIADYSDYMINNELEALIRLYFNYAKIHSNNNELRNGKYILINPELINAYKSHYNYANIEQKLNGIPFVQQIISNMNKENSEKLIDDKKICIIIKQFLPDINQQFISLTKKNKNFKININEEPNIEGIESKQYFYYNNFEIISEDIYELLIKNDDFTEGGNYRDCYFENNYMYFSVPGHFCDNIKPRNIEICILNQNTNSFNANFIIESHYSNSFEIFMKTTKLSGGFAKCLKSYEYNKLEEEICNNSGQAIGLIFNLLHKTKNANINNVNNNQFVNNNFNPNINNPNIINNPNPIFNQNFQNKNQIFIQNNFGNINMNVMNNMNNNNLFNRMNNIANNNNFINNNFINNNTGNNNNTIYQPKSIKNEFSIPPLIGLKNVGATCYMNATLQCLSQIEGLVNYFKYKGKVESVIKKMKKQNCLTKSFKILIENLWPTKGSEYLDKTYISKNSNNTYFKPEEFKKKISKMNSLFEGAQANDAKDLVNFIVMTLHEELNQSKTNSINNNISNFILDQTNEQLILNNFLQSFASENKSIISDIFYGTTHTITQCSRCPRPKHNFEAFFFLNFPLEEVRRYKMQLLNNQNLMISNQNNMNMMNMNQNIMMNNQVFQQNYLKMQLLQNNQVNIYDCFDYNQKEESFTGENSMYCNICNMQLPSTYTTYLYSTPNVLILVLNRGQGIQYKIKMEFYTEIDLTNYVQFRQNNEVIKYDLVGVVTHMGDSSASGHFIATCRSPIDQGWYQYNDDLAFPVQDLNSQILNYAMPYILFYQKRA